MDYLASILWKMVNSYGQGGASTQAHCALTYGASTKGQRPSFDLGLMSTLDLLIIPTAFFEKIGHSIAFLN